MVTANLNRLLGVLAAGLTFAVSSNAVPSSNGRPTSNGTPAASNGSSIRTSGGAVHTNVRQGQTFHNDVSDFPNERARRFNSRG